MCREWLLWLKKIKKQRIIGCGKVGRKDYEKSDICGASEMASEQYYELMKAVKEVTNSFKPM